MSSTADIDIQLLNKASGYGVLIGAGGLFSIGIIFATKLMGKYLNENAQSTENFMVANRNVGIGLTGSVVFSSWYWATEILWVVTMVYLYGIMSSFWYFAGLSVQICLMALLGIQAKKKIPNGHTCLEIVELRYGKSAHILYMFMCLVNNLLSSSSMILGAASAISIISGNLHIVASIMLIPFGVMCYTVVGGLKSTFLTDYLHSLIALIILVYFNTAIISNEKIGGISGLYEKVLEREGDRYIEGNYKGSFLTGKSQGAIFFGIIHCVGDFGLTVMDSSFWQKAFSANVKASVPGYLIAAALIPAIVWPLGTIVGLSNVVLEGETFFPTYPRTMNTYEINNGFGLPYTLMAVLGKDSLGGLLLAIYLAVTSTVSAQMISVSSIISFDIYRNYFKPNANNSELIRVSHIGVVFFGLFSAGFTVMLHYVGVDMTWMGYFYSMIICPGVIPLVLTILWDRQTLVAAIVSPIIGFLAGIAVWLGTAYKLYGNVTISSTGSQLPCMYGGLTALFLPGILTVPISLLNREYKFDWADFQKAKLIVEDESQNSSDDGNRISKQNYDSNEKATFEVETKDQNFTETFREDDSFNQDQLSSTYENKPFTSEEVRIINIYTKVAAGASVFVLLITWVVWPLPLYRDYIFSKSFFTGWTVVSIIWVYLALIFIGLYPLWDGRHSLLRIIRGIKTDLFGSEKHL
ncbi:unnamed protein product [Kluyveromyces dobzhanskii CBS 2104]|uniref:WGS project CCBQ000000000 data, contig 00104 n=1 Tax=Kluyveromyces dobzhanskii CBS 2104 TaxID=1427455 RepID=A0A0A8L5S9_9SACH|nr:unnamed protein product [Kluyveromyces dobzhanskii CBS 2104]